MLIIAFESAVYWPDNQAMCGNLVCKCDVLIADRGHACFHEVSVSHNFGARICGRPTRLDLRLSVSQNCGTRTLSPVQTTETRMSVSLWQPLWQLHLNVPSGNYSQTQKFPHRAAHVITLSHVCSVTRPVGPVNYHVAEGEKRVRRGSI